MIEIKLPTKTVEVGKISYVTFNKNNGLPYLTDDVKAPALVYEGTIYMIEGATSDVIPDKEYEYCSVRFLPDAINLLKVQEEMASQENYYLTILGALADLYNEIKSLKEGK